jgi:predicted nucleic acid-binding protein
VKCLRESARDEPAVARDREVALLAEERPDVPLLLGDHVDGRDPARHLRARKALRKDDPHRLRRHGDRRFRSGLLAAAAEAGDRPADEREREQEHAESDDAPANDRLVRRTPPLRAARLWRDHPAARLLDHSR